MDPKDKVQDDEALAAAAADNDKTADKGDELNPEQQAEVDRLTAEAEAAGTEVSDDDLEAAIKAFRGETPKDDKSAKSEKDDKGGKEGNMVPQSRLDEATGKLKDQLEALQARLEAAEQATAKTAEPIIDPRQALQEQIDEAEDMRDNALMDGDKETAAAARAVSRELQQELTELNMRYATSEARSLSSAETRYETLLTQLEKEYPIIDQDHADFDQATMRRVARISHGLQKTGTPAAEALQEAADLVLPKKSDNVNTELRDRTKKARIDAANVAAGQAPNLKDVGSSRGSVDTVLKASKLSDAQFESLPQDVLFDLRGDKLTPDQMEG